MEVINTMAKRMTKQELFERNEMLERVNTVLDLCLHDLALARMERAAFEEVTGTDGDKVTFEIKVSRLSSAHGGLALVVESHTPNDGAKPYSHVSGHYVDDLRAFLSRAVAGGLNDPERAAWARVIETTFAVRAKTLAAMERIKT